jgi:hypothetical protein
MKAIKLASVFAVSAVAAAVSTATFAAEPVFSGQAGLSYTLGESTDTFNHAGKGELDLAIDTGVVHIDVSFDEPEYGGDAKTLINAAYVKQGAVSFGDFDGSISDDAWTIGDDIVDVKSTGSGSAAIRYAVMPNLTVAIEADSGNYKKDTATADAKDSDVIGVAAKYSQDLGMATLSLSAGSVDDETSYTVGVKSEVATGVTVAASFGSYSKSEVNDLVNTDKDKGPTNSGKIDMTASGVSVAFAATDALTVTAVYGMFDNKVDGGDKYDGTGTYLNVSYKVGDITYYVENSSGDNFKKFEKVKVDATTFGAKASF